MGFKNPKEELLEIILTQHGRAMLANGDLSVKYYAFADDEIDYELNNATLLSSDTVQNVDSFYRSIGQTPPDQIPFTSSIIYVAPEVPQTVPGLLLWLDERGHTVENGVISDWQSNVRDLITHQDFTTNAQGTFVSPPFRQVFVQSNKDARPATGSLNGYLAPSFSHSGSLNDIISNSNVYHGFQSNARFTDIAPSSSYSIFVVGQLPATASVVDVSHDENYGLMGNSVQTFMMYYTQGASDHVRRFYLTQQGSDGQQTCFINNPIQYGEKFIAYASYPGSGSLTFEINLTASSVIAGPNPGGIITDSSLVIGGIVSTGISDYTGSIVSVLSYNHALTPAQKSTVYNYLTAKYITGSVNTQTASLCPVAPIDPLSITTGLTIALDETSLPASGSAVSRWINRAPTGIDFIQRSASFQPIVDNFDTFTGSAGYPCVSFTGDGRHLICESGDVNTFFSSTAWTAIIVDSYPGESGSSGIQTSPSVIGFLTQSAGVAANIHYIGGNGNKFGSAYLMSGNWGIQGGQALTFLTNTYTYNVPRVSWTVLDVIGNVHASGTFASQGDASINEHAMEVIKMTDVNGNPMTGDVAIGIRAAQKIWAKVAAVYLWNIPLSLNQLQGVRRFLYNKYQANIYNPSRVLAIQTGGSGSRGEWWKRNTNITMGTGVSQWTGFWSGSVLAQTTGSKQPLTSSNGSLLFNAAALQYLDGASGILSGARAVSWYICMSGTYDGTLVNYGPQQLNNAAAGIYTLANRFTNWCCDGGSTNAFLTPAANSVNGTFVIAGVTTLTGGGSGSSDVYINGYHPGSGSYQFNGNPGGTFATALKLAVGSVQGGGNYFSGTISDVVVYYNTRHSASQIVEVTRALRAVNNI